MLESVFKPVLHWLAQRPEVYGLLILICLPKAIDKASGFDVIGFLGKSNYVLIVGIIFLIVGIVVVLRYHDISQYLGIFISAIGAICITYALSQILRFPFYPTIFLFTLSVALLNLGIVISKQSSFEELRIGILKFHGIDDQKNEAFQRRLYEKLKQNRKDIPLRVELISEVIEWEGTDESRINQSQQLCRKHNVDVVLWGTIWQDLDSLVVETFITSRKQESLPLSFDKEGFRLECSVNRYSKIKSKYTDGLKEHIYLSIGHAYKSNGDYNQAMSYFSQGSSLESKLSIIYCIERLGKNGNLTSELYNQAGIISQSILNDNGILLADKSWTHLAVGTINLYAFQNSISNSTYDYLTQAIDNFDCTIKSNVKFLNGENLFLGALTNKTIALFRVCL